jgi:hypothetical protein
MNFIVLEVSAHTLKVAVNNPRRKSSKPERTAPPAVKGAGAKKRWQADWAQNQPWPQEDPGMVFQSDKVQARCRGLTTSTYDVCTPMIDQCLLRTESAAPVTESAPTAAVEAVQSTANGGFV